MFDRALQGLRGSVKSCTEENTFPAVTDNEGNPSPPVLWERTTEYDVDGRVTVNRSSNSDGSTWLVSHSYDGSGCLLKISSGIEGLATTQTIYSYDDQGRLQRISDPAKPEGSATFHYDEHGRKSKVETSRPEDFRPNVATAGSPFEVADRAPNLPGGGSATTLYDERDRPTEVQIRDGVGELVSRVIRTYDEQGHISEERQILDRPEAGFPPEALAKIQQESGIPMDQLRQEMGAQLTKLMGGESSSYSVSYRYDSKGRPEHMRRRIFNQQEDVATLYNEHGDVASEITRRARPGGVDDSTPTPGLPEYSEVRHSYKYDDHENWIERTVSYRSSPDGAFQTSTVTRRTLTYY